MKQYIRPVLTMLLLSMLFSVNVFSESFGIEQKLEVEEKIKMIGTKFGENRNIDDIYITDQKMVSRGVPTGVTGEFKAYMGYKSITSKSSDQWKFQQKCTTDENGFRKYEDSYVVAMGSFYAKHIEQKFLVKLDTGEYFTVVVGDFKQDRHTDLTNRFVVQNGNILEYIIDTNKICNLMKKMGNASYGAEELSGKIIRIDEIILDSEK